MTVAAAEPIRAIAFDAYGTLFDVAAAAQRCAVALGPDVGGIAALWRTKQIEYTWQRSVRGQYVDFWQVTGQALDHALAAFHIDDPALRARLMELYFSLDPYPDARPALEAVRAAGLHVVILSNGSPSMLVSAVQRAGFSPLLEALLSADQVQNYKPHASVYQLACDHFRLPPRQIGFVSANGWDVSGAAAFGFRVVWINRTSAPAECLPGTAECVIGSLDALAGVLAGLAAGAAAG